MKNIIAAVIVAVAAIVSAVIIANPFAKNCFFSSSKTKQIHGFGFVRGHSQTTLKNKYAGYVSKVNFYSYAKVKKGDVILEYDDLALRTSIKKLEHSICEQQKKVELLKIELAMTQIDPLPSQYRNLKLRYQSAKATLDRYEHEHKVYRKLSKDRVVADLTYREKTEAFKSSQADLKQLEEDLNLINKGLTSLYIKKAEVELAEAETKLKDLQEDLVLLKEEQKYYKIVAPYDGVTITNSDTVHLYDPAGTAAAAVHKIHKKRVYSYFAVDDVKHIHIGDKLKFIANDLPRDKQEIEIQVYDISSGRVVYGDKTYFLVKCNVINDPHNVLIDTIGTITLDVK